MTHRDPLGTGPADISALGAGLLAIGLSAFVYLGMADRVLGPVPALPLSVLWTLSNVIGSGLFVPVEQEIARVVAHCVAGGEDYRPALRRIAVVTVGITGIVSAACVILRGLLVRELFSGHPELVAACVLVTVAFAAQHVSRGVFAGTGRFRAYGFQLLADGLLRGILPIVVVAMGAPLITGFAAVLVIAPAISVLVTAPVFVRAVQHGGLAIPVPSWRSVVFAAGLLVSTQIASTVVIGGSAVAARILASPAEGALAAALVAALLLSRVPLLAFYAVQPALIPRITWIARRGTTAQIRKAVGGLVAGVTILGGVASAAALVLGAPVARIVFGSGMHVTGVQVALAFAAVVLFVTATVCTQSLVALRAYRLSALVWGLACACYLGMLALSPGRLQDRVMLALLVAVTFALAAGAAAVIRATRCPGRRRPGAAVDHGQPGSFPPATQQAP